MRGVPILRSGFALRVHKRVKSMSRKRNPFSKKNGSRDQCRGCMSAVLGFRAQAEVISSRFRVVHGQAQRSWFGY